MSRISVDIDGVLRDFQTGWISLYENWFDRKVDPEIAGTWDAITTGTHFETRPEFFEWFDRADGWDKLPWVPGALGALEQLHGITPLVLSTSRQTPAAVKNAMVMLRAWPKADLRTNLGDKTLVPATVHVDDSPQVAAQFVKAGRPMILFDQPWNRAVKGKGIARAHGWAETLDLIGAVL